MKHEKFRPRESSRYKKVDDFFASRWISGNNAENLGNFTLSNLRDVMKFVKDFHHTFIKHVDFYGVCISTLIGTKSSSIDEIACRSQLKLCIYGTALLSRDLSSAQTFISNWLLFRSINIQHIWSFQVYLPPICCILLTFYDNRNM